MMTIAAAVPAGAPARAPWRLVRTIALLAVWLAILFLRRPDQFLHPYIWVEDGTLTLPGYLHRGWLELFQPLNGFLVFVSKLMSILAFRISPLDAPALLAAFAIAFILAVALAIAFSPTHLQLPVVCAFTTLLVPSDAEVFAVSEYSFWWAGLLLPLVLLWREERQWLRWLYLTVGGLSSPLIVPIAGLLALRLAFERTRREAVAIVIAGGIAIAQIVVMRDQGLSGTLFLPDARTAIAFAQKLIGGFFHADGRPLPGLAITAALAIVAWSLRARLDRYFLLFVLAFFAIALTVSLRQPLLALDPFTTGPRYFFYPFILLAWLLVWLAAIAPAAVRIVIAATIAASVLIAGSRLSRRHDPVHWRTHLQACARADTYELPIHYIGNSNEMWHVKLTGAQCRDLLAHSLF